MWLMAHQCNMNRSNGCHKILPTSSTLLLLSLSGCKGNTSKDLESLLLKIEESPLAPNTYMEEASLASLVQLRELEMGFYCVGVIKHLRDYLLQSWYTRCCKVLFSMYVSFSSILLCHQPSISSGPVSSDSTRIESSQLGLLNPQMWTLQVWGPTQGLEHSQIWYLWWTLEPFPSGPWGTSVSFLKAESVWSVFNIPHGVSHTAWQSPRDQ